MNPLHTNIPAYGSPRQISKTALQNGEFIPDSFDVSRSRYSSPMGTHPAKKVNNQRIVKDQLATGRQAVIIFIKI